MMDLSNEVHDVLNKAKFLIRKSEESIASHNIINSHDINRSCSTTNSDELIDITKINFPDNETWLYESPLKNSEVKDLTAWLYQDTMDLKDIDFHAKRLSLIREIAHIDTKKSIDSRTFTRPKKRLSRPSIEQYNDGYFKMDKYNTSSENKFIINREINEQINENVGSAGEPALSNSSITIESDNITSNTTPLDFDFSQPTTSSIFDNIAANAANDVDSFQNMSPPSLVNSMCSSTFNNLMENSYIKNDPTLREIRDAELTEAMLQDYDLPVFKSFTDSCSSIGSDTHEKLTRRSSDNKLNKKNISNSKECSLNDTYTTENATVILDRTYMKDNTSEISSSDLCASPGTTIIQQSTVPKPQTIVNKDPIIITNNTSSPSILNGTYRKNVNAKLNNTFKKSPQYQSNELLNDELNRTITIVDGVDSNRLNNTKRHSYILDNRKCDSNYTTNLKRNSVGYSAGSTDSLDYMSSLSSSSKGSNKMLNMAEVDALVLQQEQSLQQVMSTPKPSSKIISKLWENNCISPITPLDRGDQLSDSEGSDDYLTVGSVGSSSSNMITACGSDAHVTKPIKSLENFVVKSDVQKPNPRSLNSIPTKSMSNNKRFDSNLRGSYSNLKTVGNNLKGSYTNLRPMNSNIKGSYTNLATTGSNIKGSYSNLKTMSSNLKASYTQLKPVVLTNIHGADTNLKIFNPNATTTVSRQGGKMASDGNLKIAEVAPTLRDMAQKGQVKSTSSLNCVAKPQVKASGLPRPISAIPRPMGSRIPGPRTDSKPASQTQRYMSRPVSKVNFDGDF